VSARSLPALAAFGIAALLALVACTAAPGTSPTPIATPTQAPTPTLAPTPSPTTAPTATPTMAPTASPTAAPTATGTAAPTGSGEAVECGASVTGAVPASIVDFAFQPSDLQVSVGQGITWTNNGDFPHTVTFDDVDCGRLNGGGSVTVAFNVAGTYSYICTIHPQMQGRVTVQP
jgi:plastocyanin